MTSDGLVGYRRTEGVAGAALVPDLAVALPVPTDQGRTYRFQIRSGIHYSNGAIVRPSDFRRGLERAFKLAELDLYGPVQYFTPLVGGHQCLQRPRACDLSQGIVPDDATDTLTFHLVTPDPDFLSQLALPASDPVPAGTPLQMPQGRSVPGTGPYVISSYSPAPSNDPHVHGRLVLTRNRQFRQWSAAAQPVGFPDEIVVRTNYSPASQVSDVEHGRADVAWDPVPMAEVASLHRNFPTQLYLSTIPLTHWLWLNVRRPPFDNLLARRAFNYAINRAALESQGAAMLPGTPTCQLLPPNFPGYVPYCPYTADPSASGHWQGPDLSKARALVRESGTTGDRVIFEAGRPAPGLLAQEVVATLRSIGYRATIRWVPSSELNGPQQQQLADQAEVGGLNYREDYAAPSDFFVPTVTCNASRFGLLSGNFGRFCDRRLDAQINSALAKQSEDPALATKDWAAIDRTVVNDAAVVPFANLLEADFVSKRVGNFEYNPQWGVLIDQLWVH
jgi:peptide/nickel transport system substrate-binding protein